MEEQKVIVTCPKCGQKLRCVAGGVGTCPKCGTRIAFPKSTNPVSDVMDVKPAPSGKTEKKKTSKKKPVLISLAAVVVLAAVAFGAFQLRDMLADQDEAVAEDTSPSVNLDYSVEYNGETIDPTQGTDGPSMNVQRPQYNAAADPDATLADATQTYTLSAGMYTIGEDIAPGVYDIAWVSGRGNCFVDDSEGSSVVNEIFGDDAASGYITSYNNARLVSGGEVEIAGGLVVAFQPPA